MLMLQESQIHKIEVFCKKGNKIIRLPGVRYARRLFTHQNSFSKAQKEESLECCRQAFSHGQEKLMVLLLENEKQFSVWVENTRAKLAGPQDRVDLMPLKVIVAKMRGVHGIKIKDRTHLLKVYPACFVGTEAVRWLMRRLKLSREDALRLGQRLIDEKWVHHVSDAHKFKDENLFYRFFLDER